ncbi:amidohydrolase family protein [Maricaulis sp.]|uniref:amidohydrolase family protein n=1 Tax=Maricaulis sp. TaxID=1486257 RepID=UPI00260C7B46|nr:amidohydrolase family protein [Maricaulis sp.]
MMIRSRLLGAVAGLVLATGLPACAASQPEPMTGELYFGFTRLDPVARTAIEDSYVVVEDGLIRAAGSGTPPAGSYSASYDLTGRYGLPGLIDAHGHITAGPHAVEVIDGSPTVTIESRDDVVRYHALASLAFGVTTVRNPGGDPQAGARYDANIASGEWLGPDAVHAGAVIQPPPFGGNAFAYPTTPEEWDAEAARQAELGVTYFKLYHALTEEELAEGVRAADAHGLEVIAHLDQVSWMRAVEIGVDGLLHALPTSADLLEPGAREQYLASRGPNSKFYYQWFELADFDGPLMQNLFRELAERQIEVDLTLLVNFLVYRRDAFNELYGPDDRFYVHPEALAATMSFLGASGVGWTDEDYARADAAMQQLFAFVRHLDAAGVPLMVGTDGPGGGSIYWQELQLHADAGLDPWRILELATSGNAQGMGLGETTGRIEAGFEADLAFFNADPRLDLENLRQLDRVVSNGRTFTRTELDNLIEEEMN